MGDGRKWAAEQEEAEAEERAKSRAEAWSRRVARTPLQALGAIESAASKVHTLRVMDLALPRRAHELLDDLQKQLNNVKDMQ